MADCQALMPDYDQLDRSFHCLLIFFINTSTDRSIFIGSAA
jgi:hypothetical protein